MSASVAGAVHGYADLGGVLIHYVTAGSGPPLVLLHGWPQTWYEWRHIVPALAPHYTLVMPDLRGLGDSSRPADGYDKKTVANDIWRLVHDRLGHQRVSRIHLSEPTRLRRIGVCGVWVVK